MKNILFFLILSMGLVACEKDSIGSFESASSGGKGGSTASMITYQGHMYILDNRTLITMHLEVPSKPVETSRVDVGTGAETLFAYNNNLYVGTRTGLLIYSLADLAKPVYAGTNFHIYAKDPVVVKDNYAYLTRKNGTETINPSGVLEVLDVRNPQSPFTIWQTDQQYPSGLAAHENYLYVCNGAYGLNVFSLDNPAQPSFISGINHAAVYDCIPDGNLLICQAKDGILLYDITERANPVFIKTIK